VFNSLCFIRNIQSIYTSYMRIVVVFILVQVIYTGECHFQLFSPVLLFSAKVISFSSDCKDDVGVDANKSVVCGMGLE
jgi:hypothetical protein